MNRNHHSSPPVISADELPPKGIPMNEQLQTRRDWILHCTTTGLGLAGLAMLNPPALFAADDAETTAAPVPTGAIIIRLDDVHGLFGGQTLALDADGNLFVRKVRGRQEQRYHLKLPADELAALLVFIPESGILGYQEHKRPGVPDEARPRITLSLPDRKKLTADKWANDKAPHFDKLYERLLQLVERAAKTPPYREGQFEAIADAKSGVVMAVVMPERIAVPPRDGEAKFEIGLRITNRTNQDISIDLFDTVRPVLKDGQGRELPLAGGRDKTSIPKPVEVKAGQNDTVLYAARLSVPEGKKHPRLVVDDRTGGIWVYHDLAPGRYTLGLEYAHPPAGGVAQPGRWVGATTTAPAAFEVAAIQKP